MVLLVRADPVRASRYAHPPRLERLILVWPRQFHWLESTGPRISRYAMMPSTSGLNSCSCTNDPILVASCRVVRSICTAHAMRGGLTAELLAIFFFFFERERETRTKHTAYLYQKCMMNIATKEQVRYMPHTLKCSSLLINLTKK